MRTIRRLLTREDGIGIVTALAVSFIVFSLGATWYALATHELDEVAFDRHRTQALHAAEAGIREATAMLATDVNNFRTDTIAAGFNDFGTTGPLGSEVCTLSELTSTDPLFTDVQAEYWVRVVSLGDSRYALNAWGWAPRHTSRQAAARHVELEVTLIPLGGFKDALFAAGGGIVGSNRKEIYGTVYSGNNLVLGNFTRVYKNDLPYPGSGSVTVYGNLTIPNGSSVEIRGDVEVQGTVQDQNGSTFLASVITRNWQNLPPRPMPMNNFKKAYIDAELKSAGARNPASTFTSVGLINDNVTDLVDIPQITLPTFAFNAADYAAAGYTIIYHANLTAMQVWLDANKTDLKGIHVVANGGGAVTFHQMTFTDDFMMVVFKNPLAAVPSGNVNIKGTPSGGSTPAGDPATVVLVTADSASLLELGQSFQSIPEEVHHLVFANGDFASVNQTTVYGAVYGERDISSNRLEIHFRPPNENFIEGAFEFDPSLADRFIAEPGIWNTGSESAYPISAFCSLP